MEKEEIDETEVIVAVGLTGSRKSKYILRWAMEKFLPEGNVRFRILHIYPKITIVPTPIGTWLPVAQVREEVINSYRQALQTKKKKPFVPYQQALKEQKIKSDIVVLESDDIAMTLCLEVDRHSIRHLVVGPSSTSIFSRKHLSLTKMLRDHNISAAISKNAPSFCSVYVVADGKLQNLRSSESEPTVISIDNTSGSSTAFTNTSSSSSSLTIGRLLKSKPSSPKYPGFGSNPSTKSPNNMVAQIRIMEPVDTFHYTMSYRNDSPASNSFSSGDSGSWVSERTSPENSLVSFTTNPIGSLVGTTPTGSYAGTSPAVSFAGTYPPASFRDTTPPGSFVGTPPSRLSPTSVFVGTPPRNSLVSFTSTQLGSLVGTTPAGSYAGTSPAVSFAGTYPSGSFRDITPPGSFVGTPPAGLSSTSVFVSTQLQQPPSSSEEAISQGQNKTYELEKLRMELRHAEKMYQLAHNNSIDEKVLFPLNQLNTLSKERLEALKLTKEKAKETAKTGNNKPRYKEETDAAQKAQDNENKLKQLLASPITQGQKFSWNEIVEATLSLSEEFKIGAGAFGTVYKCKLHHTTVAVKVLHSKDTVTNKQFLQELEILSTIRHPHILLLLGAVPEESCLVYEYMENGSLEDRLFQKGNCPPFPWYERVRICWEVAGALAFLHSTKPRPIIHRDLKPANILLDHHLVSKIGDAGLGTTITMEPSDKCLKTLYKETSPVGTLCYIDPEYQRTGRVSTKSDIYALGIVILQLLTTKSAVGIAYLVEDAVEEGTLMEVLDREAGKWPEEVALELASLGLLCSELRGRDRPDLIEIVLPTLEKLKEAADIAREQAANAPAALPAHFICPICKDIMNDPYVAADGYTYNRAALEKWLAENSTSPTTNLPLPHKFIMPNNTILEAIIEWKSKQPPK